MSESLSIAHYISLSAVGGVERQFDAFVATAARRDNLRQTAVVASKSVHPAHRAALSTLADRRGEKSILGVGLPHHPKQLRRYRQRWLARRQRPDLALLWNRLGQQSRVLDALGARRCLYWEHGSAWLAGEQQHKQAVLDQLPAVICNSYAARRMLELRWGYRGNVRVCLNGVAAQSVGQARHLPANRTLRLGVACRLIPIKAVCLALHTLAVLRDDGLDVELDIAGDGPLRDTLKALAQRLGISAVVHFSGVVNDMSDFFTRIDLLLHTALREPFGMVAAEAQAAGVPVVCTAVDGLPEVVADGLTGACVAPSGDLNRYRELGGDSQGLPPVVYRPDDDDVGPPRIVEPAALAVVIQTLLEEPARYRAMSTAAIERVHKCFDFDRHVEDVLGAAHEYVATGTLAARP